MMVISSGRAISFDDGAGQYEGIGIHCIRFKQWIIDACLELALSLVRGRNDCSELSGGEMEQGKATLFI